MTNVRDSIFDVYVSEQLRIGAEDNRSGTYAAHVCRESSSSWQHRSVCIAILSSLNVTVAGELYRT